MIFAALGIFVSSETFDVESTYIGTICLVLEEPHSAEDYIFDFL